MAVDLFGNDIEDQNKQNLQNPIQQTGNAGGGVVSGGSSGGGAAPAAGQPTNSGSYTNLQQYLNANADSGFGSQVAGKVQNDLTSADQFQQGASDTFKGKVDQGTTTENKDLLNQAVSAPTSVAGDSQKTADFTKMRDAQYGGPQSFASDTSTYQPIKTQIDNATAAAGMSDTDSGRETILNQYYGSGSGNQAPRYDYSQGQKSLDNFLMQGDPNAQSAFAQDRTNAADLNNRFGQLSNTLDQYATQGQNTTKQTQADTRNALGIDDKGAYNNSGAIGNLNSAVQNQYNQATTNQAAQFKQEQDALKNGNYDSLSPQQQSQLGLNANQVTYGIDPSKYLSENSNLTPGSVATAGQQADMAALTQLAGLQNTFLPDASVAGTQSTAPLVNFDNAGFNSAIQPAQAAYYDAVGNVNAMGTPLKTWYNGSPGALWQAGNLSGKPIDQYAAQTFGSDPATLAALNQLMDDPRYGANKTLGGTIPNF